ncbi:hypothetical protein F8388_021976 [Cannabis sativa]|uniref:Retrotransposon gag domain-containing protein n=1 Tax=Cannabis sativa TaxID=3483 RepID=A0A7J6FG24_CANSA|nr:hypothetical protein F8388_021976 [Cannabis sativa]KAF4392590.1 hypothetical protein G4B88_015233 [Cannabis sativa]
MAPTKKAAKNDQERTEEMPETEEHVDAKIECIRHEMRQFKEEITAMLEKLLDKQADEIPDMRNTNSVYEHRWHCRLRRLQLPIFDGTDHDGWLLRADKYFTLQRFSIEEMLEAAAISFEGKALTWYRWELRRRLIILCEDLRLLVLNKFRNTSKGSLHEQFCQFRQEGSMEEYCKGFLELLAPLNDVSEVVALSQFLTGLKKNIKEELRLFEPNTLKFKQGHGFCC